MGTDFIILIATMIIGFIGIFVMISQINSRFDSVNGRIDAVNAKFDAVNAKIDDLRSEIKADLNALEIKFNTLLMGLFRDYYRPEPPTKQDKSG